MAVFGGQDARCFAASNAHTQWCPSHRIAPCLGVRVSEQEEERMLVLGGSCLLVPAALGFALLLPLLRYKRAARFGHGWFFGQVSPLSLLLLSSRLCSLLSLLLLASLSYCSRANGHVGPNPKP